MRVRRFCCLLVLTLTATYATAAHHSATLSVVTSVTEDAPAPPGGAWSGTTAIRTPSSSSCPQRSTSAAESGGQAGQCQWSGSSVDTTKVKSTNVRAFLTTETGEVYDISMVCYRTYGSCPEPKAGTDYAVELSDDPKYLANYAKRRVYGPMAVKFSPDGKKKVSYDISFAMKAGSTQTRPD